MIKNVKPITDAFGGYRFFLLLTLRYEERRNATL